MIKVKTLIMPIGVTTTLSRNGTSSFVSQKDVCEGEESLNQVIKKMEDLGYEVFDVKVNHFVCEKHDYADDILVQYTIMGRK